MRRRWIAAGTAALLVAGGATGGALAVAGNDEGEGRATGVDADRAAAAALAITPGTVNAVEREGEQGATWEVEVTRPDGTTVDVLLDAAFELVALDGDSEQESSPDDQGDDGDAGEDEEAGEGG